MSYLNTTDSVFLAGLGADKRTKSIRRMSKKELQRSLARTERKLESKPSSSRLEHRATRLRRQIQKKTPVSFLAPGPDTPTGEPVTPTTPAQDTITYTGGGGGGGTPANGGGITFDEGGAPSGEDSLFTPLVPTDTVKVGADGQPEPDEESAGKGKTVAIVAVLALGAWWWMKRRRRRR